MMLTSLMVLKFESTVKSITFDDVIILKENMKCQYLGNETKYEAELWYMEVIHNADFDYYVEIGNN